ncbi:MAG: MmgE/PrpD family protein [Deltaproteobacteria bacterium]|nr:MmgE/PrpD family protein [Deltaproteobacteria bacterium]
MNPTEKLAAFVAETTADKVPREVFERSKWPVLDGLAVTLAGHNHEVGRAIVSFVRELGGNPVATVLADGFRTSAPMAAYANGTLSHALDYDDVNVNIGGHPTVPVLSAILAVGEMVKATGQEFLLAYILGVEAETKLGRAIIKVFYNLGWHPTSTLGTLGAAAACSKLLGLDAEKTLMALGIAGSAASGLKQNFGTMTKPLHLGQSAKNGVLAAMLAQRGWTADRRILEGHFGFCNLFCGRDQYDLREMTEYLGNPWEILDPGISLKKYPCCGSIHSSLDAMFELLKETPLRADQVKKVECQVDPTKDHTLVHPRPCTGLEGKFSLEYCLAASILDGKVGLAQFEDEKIRDPRVQDLLPRIVASKDEKVANWGSRVRIETTDGRVLFRENGPSSGITLWDDLAAKYRDCAVPVLGPHGAERALGMVQGLEEMSNISELVQMLVRS